MLPLGLLSPPSHSSPATATSLHQLTPPQPPTKLTLNCTASYPPLGGISCGMMGDLFPLSSVCCYVSAVQFPLSLLRQLDNWRRVGQSIGGSVMLGVRSVVGERSIEESVVVARARSLASFCLGSELWSWSLVMIVADAVVSFAWRAGWWGGLCKGDAREMGDGGG